jgi:AcrR family transcriptional regulator
MGRPKTIEDAELLDAARRVFRQHGHTATTQQVAKAAGISEAILYKRFKTKDELFFAALNRPAANLSALSDIDPKLEPRAFLAIFSARTKDHFRQAVPSIISVAAHPRYGKEMMGQVHRHNRAGEIAAVLRLRLESWHQSGRIRTTNIVSFTNAFLHALHSMAMVEVFSGEAAQPTEPKDMESFLDVFWEALRPTGEVTTRKKRSTAR